MVFHGEEEEKEIMKKKPIKFRNQCGGGRSSLNWERGQSFGGWRQWRTSIKKERRQAEKIKEQNIKKRNETMQ